MKNTDLTIISNIPEKISGLGFKAHFIGFSLYIALLICSIPCVLVDNTWIKDSIDLIVSSGIFVILSFIFIFILCPLYFFIRFIMEVSRTIKNRNKFYSEPNIEYIKLNNDEIYFKNTHSDKDIKIKKSDITRALLNGDVKTTMGISFAKTPKTSTYIENLVLTIKTNNENYTIFPKIYDNDTLKQQIAFYKSYFENIDVLFNYSGTDTISNIQSMVTAYELEVGKIEKETGYFDIILKIITYIIIIAGTTIFLKECLKLFTL